MSFYRSGKYETARLGQIANLVHRTGGSVLDIGHAQAFNPYLPAVRTTGFDRISVDDCPYFEQIQGDVVEINFLLAGRNFDTVIAGELIEHLENPYAFLRNIRNLISPGGRVILSTPNPVAFPTLFCEWVRTKHLFYDVDHTYYFAPRWVERLLAKSGYRVHDIQSVGLWPFPKIPVPSGLSYQIIYSANPEAEMPEPFAESNDTVAGRRGLAP